MSVPLTGQAVCTGASNAIPLSSSQVRTAAFTIRAPLGNLNPVAIGGSTVTTSTGHLLDPGGEFTYTRNVQQGANRYELQPSDLYVAGVSGDKVTWFGSPAP